jgi:hypothetical protein
VVDVRPGVGGGIEVLRRVSTDEKCISTARSRRLARRVPDERNTERGVAVRCSLGDSRRTKTWRGPRTDRGPHQRGSWRFRGGTTPWRTSWTTRRLILATSSRWTSSARARTGRRAVGVCQTMLVGACALARLPTHQSMIACQQRIQVHRYDRPRVERPQRGIVVRYITLHWRFAPSRRIVPTCLSSRGQLRKERFALGLVQSR